MLRTIAMCAALVAIPIGVMAAKPRCSSNVKKIYAEDQGSAELTVADVSGSVDEFITVNAVTNCKKVGFFAVTKGLSVFPRKMLASTTSTVVVARAPGDYQMAAYTALSADELSDPVMFTVHVGGVVSPVPAPAPPGPVTPTPPAPMPVNPTPAPLPAGRFGLAQFTYDAITSSLVKAKRAPCAAIGENYALVASQIAAGTIKTTADANAAIKAANHADVPAADVAAWTTVFAALNAKCNSLKLTQLTDWQQVYVELGQGFSAASQSSSGAP